MNQITASSDLSLDRDENAAKVELSQIVVACAIRYFDHAAVQECSHSIKCRLSPVTR
jgi:hypothetical protein